MKLTNKFAVAATAAALFGSALAQDRVGQNRLDLLANQQVQARNSVFAVVPKSPSTNSDGLQFRIAYDPAVVRVSNTSDCLMGLSKGVRDALVSCRHIAEKNVVQVAIVDLSQQGLIPADLEIGMIEFETIGKRGSNRSAVWVEDVHVSGARSESADEAVTIQSIDY